MILVKRTLFLLIWLSVWCYMLATLFYEMETMPAPITSLLDSSEIFRLYEEKAIWSKRYPAWTNFSVKNSRFPDNTDFSVRWVETKVNRPSSLSTCQGDHNDQIIQSLLSLRYNFVNTKILPNSIIIHGASGSGKSILAKLFTQQLVQDLGLGSHGHKFLLEEDTSLYLMDYSKLWLIISSFADPPLDKYIETSYRIIVLDNFDSVPPSHQQKIKRLMISYSNRVRWMLVCSDLSKLLSHFHANGLNLKTKSISEENALLVVLRLCFKSRIGYDRHGIMAVFQLFREEHFSLSKIIDFIQRVFVKFTFVSWENVLRHVRSSTASQFNRSVSITPKVRASTPIEPIDRCKICTLHPPCRHISSDEIIAEGVKARNLYPRNKGAAICSEFSRSGRCSVFKKYQNCSLDHPKDLHIVTNPRKRCGQCTLPWPCGHCAYTPRRLKLIELVGEIQKRAHLLQKLMQPEILPKYTRNLDQTYPDGWKDQMRVYGDTFLTVTKEKQLHDTLCWVQESYCMSGEEYFIKDALLRRAFSEMLQTPMLDRFFLYRKNSEVGVPQNRRLLLPGSKAELTETQTGSILSANTSLVSSSETLEMEAFLDMPDVLFGSTASLDKD